MSRLSVITLCIGLVLLMLLTWYNGATITHMHQQMEHTTRLLADRQVQERSALELRLIKLQATLEENICPNP